MLLHEVGKNYRRNIKDQAQGIVQTWEKEQLNRYAMAWLIQLASDERLLGKLLVGSKQYKLYGGDGNESFLDSAATYAHAYNILSKIRDQKE
jgi:hypothetical protein